MPPLFAVQLLTASKSLNLRQALGFVVLMVAGCVLSVLIAQIFVDTPFVLILVISLLIFLAFLMLAKGRAVPVANILLITVSVVPLVAVTSIELAYGLVYTLIAGSILAVLLVFLAYAFFPARDTQTKLPIRPPKKRFPVGAALANAAVLMSLVILFISSGSAVSVIIIMTAITILRQPPIAGQAPPTGLSWAISRAVSLPPPHICWWCCSRHLPSSCLSFCCSGSSLGPRSRRVVTWPRFTLSGW